VATGSAGDVSITALPVAHGDALWVEYGRRSDTHRLLIDGGPASTYKEVRAWLAKLPPTKRRIDLFVVTHIDADHIDGAILLLQELQQLGISIEEVWFNGWRQLGQDASEEDMFAPAQGEFLGALIQEAQLRWNAAFMTDAVVVPDTGPLPRRDLAGGASLTLLSPQPRQLRRLRRNWYTVARDAGWPPGDTTSALNRLAARHDYEPPARIDVFGGERYGADNSVANGSSIAFVLEYEGIRCLFTGDAVASVLTKGLERLAAEPRTGELRFDLVKLPHHGSMANINERLVELMVADRFLVSTNGAQYGHPDAEAIELILKHTAVPNPQLYFNYDSDTTRQWRDPDRQKDRGYRAIYPSNGPGITITLRP
jgi:beta-lactamase superfamily II metal-dependent hydrolase